MRRLVLLALVFGAAALAQFPQHRVFEQPNLARQAIVTALAGWGGGFFSAFSSDAGYRGLDTALTLQQALDTRAAGWDAGQWLVFSGDSTGVNVLWDGGALVVWGTGQSNQSDTVLPNGASGGAVASRRFTTAGGLVSNTAVAPFTLGGASGTGLTWCADLAQDAAASNTWLFSHATGTSNGSYTYNFSAQTGNLVCTMSDGTTARQGSKSGLVGGARQVLCCVIDSGDDGGITAYVDGVGGTKTAGLAALDNETAKPTWHGFNGQAAGVANAHRLFGGMVTNKPLTAAQLLSVAGAVLADVPRGVTGDGDAGVALVTVRASARTCPERLDGWGAVSTLPNNRPCVTNGKLGGFAAGTNNAQQSETLCTAPWVNQVPCTANVAIAPNGTLTGESLYHDGGTSQCWTQALATTSATRHAFGAYITGGTSAAATVALVGTGSSTGDCTASSTSLDAGAAYRLECTSPAAYAGTLTGVTMSICADAPGLIYVWGAQHETGKTAAAEKLAPYFATTSAAGTWSADSHAWNYTLPTPGSMAASVILGRTGGNLRVLSAYRIPANDSDRVEMYVNSGQLIAAQVTAGVTANKTNSTAIALNTETRVSMRLEPSAVIGATTNGVEQTLATGVQGAMDAGQILYLGKYPGGVGWEPNGYIGDVCYSPLDGGCR